VPASTLTAYELNQAQRPPPPVFSVFAVEGPIPGPGLSGFGPFLDSLRSVSSTLVIFSDDPLLAPAAGVTVQTAVGRCGTGNLDSPVRAFLAAAGAAGCGY